MAALEIPGPEEWVEPLAIANRIFREVKMFGIGAVEYKRHRDGRFLILEPCVGRTVYSHEIGPLNGYDIPWAAYRHLAFRNGRNPDPSDGQPSGRHAAQPPPARGTHLLIDVPRARAAEREYLRRGIFTKAEIRKVFAQAHLDMTYRLDDPMPHLLTRISTELRKAGRGVPRWARNALRLRKTRLRGAVAGG